MSRPPPDGSVWFTDPIFGIIMPSQGSLAEPELDHRSVYRFDPATGRLGRMADVEQPNGLAFTADGRRLATWTADGHAATSQ